MKRLLRAVGVAACVFSLTTILGAAGAAGADGFIVVDSLDAVRSYAAAPGVKVRLKPGTYRLDRAATRHFLILSGAGSHWDFHGVRLQVDNTLFAQWLPPPAPPSPFYCAISITGEGVVLEGLTTENIGGQAGIQSRNKIINVAAAGVVVRDVDITTSGSSPWGYGSLFGISGGDVRKMNGIRVGWPARGARLIGCRVHMRAMGHGIFVQGAQDTVIEDCHIDGLLRPTEEILAEKSGYAFERGFIAHGRDYIEGVRVGADGRILPGEIIALSEDGIRLYDRGGRDQPTGRTTIRRCTVTRMRRGICTGIGPAADTIVDCEVRDCVAAGFNLGTGDVLEHGRADAHYSEALCIASPRSRGVKVDLEVLDSRGGRANDLLAVINGREHRVRLWTQDAANVPPAFTVALATTRGYAFYQRDAGAQSARAIELVNETDAPVVLSAGAADNRIASKAPVDDRSAAPGANRVRRL